MLRLYEFTVLRFYRLWLHNFTNLPFYGFTASGSSRSTTLMHDACTNLPFYGFTVFSCSRCSRKKHQFTTLRFYLGFLRFHLLHGSHLLYSFTLLRLYYLIIIIIIMIMRFQIQLLWEDWLKPKNDPRRLASFIHPVACHISWSGIQPKTLRCRRSFCAVV